MLVELTSPVSSLGLRVIATRFTGSTTEKFSGDIIDDVSFRILRHCKWCITSIALLQTEGTETDTTIIHFKTAARNKQSLEGLISEAIIILERLYCIY